MKTFLALALLLMAEVAPMRVSSISPTSGQAGTQITIIGENFDSDCTVRIGHSDAPIISSSDTQLVVTAPKGYKGKKALIVLRSKYPDVIVREAFEYTE